MKRGPEQLGNSIISRDKNGVLRVRRQSVSPARTRTATYHGSSQEKRRRRLPEKEAAICEALFTLSPYNGPVLTRKERAEVLQHYERKATL